MPRWRARTENKYNQADHTAKCRGGAAKLSRAVHSNAGADSEEHAVSLGVDYGTESGRVIVLDLVSGRELAHTVVPYRHGVVDRWLPDQGRQLPPDWALQHPQDYLDVLHEGIPKVMAEAGIEPDQVIGIGVDFTSCTVIPVDRAGEPLVFSPKWLGRPHAWPKLWKHHAAQAIADRMNAVAEARNEAFLARYGGKISAEWYFPKLIQIFEEDREVYDAMSRFIEAADWIVWYLTGHETRNACTAGYKALWSVDEGIPSPEYFAVVSPEFDNPGAKLGSRFYPLGTSAGTVRFALVQEFGLSDEVVVAVGNVDAMVSAPSVGVNGPGSLVMIMGTSTCHLTLTEKEVRLPGITGVVRDGVVPGWYGYEAGQAAVGDMFAWFVKTAVPGEYERAAAEEGLSIYAYLEFLAERMGPGQCGLVALDWWNGNRSILGDADLSGVIVGLTIATTVEEQYRGLLESTALGTRRIIENFAEHGIALSRLVACGGLAQKSPLLMQIYADVTGLPVSVTDSEAVSARGSALFGAVAAGKGKGGFDTIGEASGALAAPVRFQYTPDPAVHVAYNQVYSIYRDLYALVGNDATTLLHRLKALRRADGSTVPRAYH